MANDEDDGVGGPPLRLVNFVSEDQLNLAKRRRGERPDDGTAQRDKPLYEILKENKDKKDAEFNERFKHRPPKALDEDETEFLDKLEMIKRGYEKQLADEEAEHIRSFQEAVKSQSNVVRELPEINKITRVEEQKQVLKRNHSSLPVVISVKAQIKKAISESSCNSKGIANHSKGRLDEPPTVSKDAGGRALVSYSDDESGEDD